MQIPKDEQLAYGPGNLLRAPDSEGVMPSERERERPRETEREREL